MRRLLKGWGAFSGSSVRETPPVVGEVGFASVASPTKAPGVIEGRPGPSNFLPALETPASERSRRLLGELRTGERPLEATAFDAYAIDGYLPPRYAAEVMGIGEAALAELVGRGILTWRLVGAHVFVRPALVTVSSVVSTDSARASDDDDDLDLAARTLDVNRRRLTKDQRVAAAASLRERGHSLRAIGIALGIGKSQVERDLVDGTVPDRIVGLDGVSRPSRRSVR